MSESRPHAVEVVVVVVVVAISVHIPKIVGVTHIRRPTKTANTEHNQCCADAQQLYLIITFC